MTKKKNAGTIELSYYRLSLLNYLKDAHPDLCADTDFIKKRADEAAETYSRMIRDGATHPQAEEEAAEELFRGLHFSTYNTIVNILWNEFADKVHEDDARRVALALLPQCKDVLVKYELDDDFADTLSYDMLYTEVTGTIQILIEDGSL